MSIKFVCVCGKRLRAREDMASRRSVCPRCGRPVGIPSLQPTHRGTEARPMTALDRLVRSRSQPTPPAPSVTPPANPKPGRAPVRMPRSTTGAGDQSLSAEPPRPLDPSVVKQVLPTRRRKTPAPNGRRSWFGEEVRFGIQASLYALGLAGVLTVVTGALILLLPELLQTEGPLVQQGAWIAPAVAVLVIVTGYAFALVDGALMTGCAGKPPVVCWPGRDIRLAVKASGRWLFCLMAGPVVGLYAAFRYWIYCGQPQILDWVIIAEIGGLSLGYWLLLLSVVAQRGRLLDAHPIAAVLLLGQLGPVTVIVLFGAGAALLAHAVLLLHAIGRMHGHIESWLILGGCYVSLLVSGVLCCRWLGRWCYRRTG